MYLFIRATYSIYRIYNTRTDQDASIRRDRLTELYPRFSRYDRAVKKNNKTETKQTKRDSRKRCVGGHKGEKTRTYTARQRTKKKRFL